MLMADGKWSKVGGGLENTAGKELALNHVVGIIITIILMMFFTMLNKCTR